jgi:uncharacterized protein involved in exopolysaccharide biosynthesis
MAETLRIPHRASESRIDWRIWKRYLYLGLIANVLLWGTALIYLQLAPKKYTSDWMVTLPPSGEQTNISFPAAGASSVTPSVEGSSYDLRSNYQYIASSISVLKAAAASLNMNVSDFGSPRITSLKNTTLMRIECEGNSPEEAQLKSIALHKALEARLSELRTQEAAQREASLQSSLASSQKRLKDAQQSLSNYKTRSGFSSGQQITELVSSIEQMRRQRAQLLTQQQQSEARLSQLLADSSNSQQSAQQASDALRLQSDSQFQQILSNYTQSKAALVDLSSKYTPYNPTVVNTKERLGANQVALLARSQSLLGKSVSLGYIKQLSLNNTGASGSPRQQLFQQIVAAQADKQGLQAQTEETSQQMAVLEGRLKTLVQQQTTLDNLQRDVQMAEAIFASTLARLDVRNSNVFGSFPLVQLIKEPMPGSLTKPNTLFVLVGTTLGSIFLTAGILSIQFRNRKVQSRRRVESARLNSVRL